MVSWGRGSGVRDEASEDDDIENISTESFPVCCTLFLTISSHSPLHPTELTVVMILALYNLPQY